MSFRSAPRSGAHGNSRFGRRLADVLETGTNRDDGGVDGLVNTLRGMNVTDSVSPQSRNQSERWDVIFSRAGLLDLDTASGPYGFLMKWVVDHIRNAATMYDSYQLSQEEYNEQMKTAARQLQYGKEYIKQREAAIAIYRAGHA